MKKKNKNKGSFKEHQVRKTSKRSTPYQNKPNLESDLEYLMKMTRHIDSHKETIITLLTPP